MLLDRDVAALYGVETKRVNEAVRNNPDKFPLDYMFQLNSDELESLRSKFSSANLSSKSRALPKAFTEKGLYMLATVLKSRQAIEATFAIIETFANVRAMKRELLALHTEPDAKKRDSMMRHFGEALTDIVMPDLTTAETESSMEINFLIGKLKHTVRRVRKVGCDSCRDEAREEMKIYAISDMHGQLEGLDPKGMDLVLIAGDFARLERLNFIGVCNQVNWVQYKFCAWCANYPQTQFRLIPGNHDIFAQELKMLDQIRWPGNVKMLIDSEDEVGGLRIYGTPWIPHINGCWAFEAPLNSSCLADRFSAIPEGLDILLTHTPPKVRHQKLDVSLDTNSPHFGSEELTEALHRAQPRIALCGHIHSGDHKPYELAHANGAATTIRNVSRLNEDYRITYEPFIFEFLR